MRELDKAIDRDVVGVIAISWITLVLALIAMIVGHTGSDHLHWSINHISTYAATGPRGRWITASIHLSCLTLLCISLLISRHKILGDHPLAHTAPLFVGATITGLLMLARFEETARAGTAAIRQQSLHDAGLSVFFYSAISLAALLGVLMIARSVHWKQRILGGAVAAFGLAALPLMVAPWPQYIGLREILPGLTQRASLLSIWVAFVIVLIWVSNRIRKGTLTS